ncbi:hypothetical protein AVEN_8049-1, partial [Araneus ventricosus]
EKGTKAAERIRCAKRHTVLDAVLSELLMVNMPQEQFFSNDCNEGRLVAMLRVKLEIKGVFKPQRMQTT